MSQEKAIPDTGSITTHPLSEALGAEIRGIDLRNLSQGDAQSILRIWHDNLVVLLRNQELSEADQVKFGQAFGGGALAAGHISELEGPNQGVAYVTNVPDAPIKGILPDGEMQFHSDQCYREHPSKGTMLYAIEVPSQGGNTLFANAYAAYETLPQAVKTRLDGLKALNVYDYGLNPTRRGAPNPDAPSWVHPVVRTHPITKRKALFVNRLMTATVEGLARDDSDALLNMLFEHQEKPEFVYAHQWRPGDVLIWDNRCALHARTNFNPAERRHMRRITLPAEAVQ